MVFLAVFFALVASSSKAEKLDNHLSLFMGEDTIYFARKSIPRLFVSLALVFVCIFVLILGFPRIANSGWFLVLVPILFGLMFTHLGLEYRRSKRLVQGTVGGLSISDLTKAISWLSSLAQGGKMFGIGPGRGAWINVGRVADHLGGEFKSKWSSIVQNHKMPIRERNVVLAFPAILLPLFLMIFIFGWVKNGFVQLIALSTLAVATIVTMYLLSKKLTRTGSDLYESEEVMVTAEALAQQLILWVSTRTTRPIRVVLANGKYEHVRTVDTAWGSTIAEIEPSTTEFGHEESHDTLLKDYDGSLLALKRNWGILTVLVHVVAGFITVYMLLLGLPRILLGTADELDIEGFGLIAILVPLCQYFIYFMMPMMKMFFAGGKVSASDIHTILKRTPKSFLPIGQHPDFDEKTDFLMTLSEKQHLRVSELEDSIRLWLREEENQPSKKRYLLVDGNIVSLTPRGEELVRLAREKIHPENAI